MKNLILTMLAVLLIGFPAVSAQTKKNQTIVKRTVVKKKNRKIIRQHRVARKRIRKIRTEKMENTNSSQAVTTASGLTYLITKHGDGAAVKAGDNVIVNYTGLLTNGQKFDSSLDRGEPFSFPVGGGRVIKGWDEGLQHLRIGDHAILTIPASIGYGSRGAGGVIPPDATLIFIIEVLGVK